VTPAARASSGVPHAGDGVSAAVADTLRALRTRLPVAEARILLCHVLGWSHARLAAHPEQELSAAQVGLLQDLVQRRVRGEPLAYLTGAREFYGRAFRVGPQVLIPRPETELLVDVALDRLRATTAPAVLDLGTGSGVLAITLALEIPAARIVAVDRSAEALDVARENARNLGATVRFIASDWFAALDDERFDLIVANPPYVAAGDPHLFAGDLRFEPEHALCDGSGDGLASIRHIAKHAGAHLLPGGWLTFEHGYDQASRCRAMLELGGFVDVASLPDLANIDRVTRGRRAPA
jgi:release factor glutamine methyltransferase